jgi:hypothetical protein
MPQQLHSNNSGPAYAYAMRGTSEAGARFAHRVQRVPQRSNDTWERLCAIGPAT